MYIEAAVCAASSTSRDTGVAEAGHRDASRWVVNPQHPMNGTSDVNWVMDKSVAPKPDGRRLRGDRTRQAIISHAVAVVAEDGLNGLSFGRVAVDSGVPKSTLQTLFCDREALQVHVLERSAEDFADSVRQRVPEGCDAFKRLELLCEAWFDVVAAAGAPGGCLVTAAHAEFRGQNGRLAELAASHRARWRQALQRVAEAAQAEGAIASNVDIEQLVFEILALQGAANLYAKCPETSDFIRARNGVRALLQRAAPPRCSAKNASIAS